MGGIDEVTPEYIDNLHKQIIEKNKETSKNIETKQHKIVLANTRNNVCPFCNGRGYIIGTLGTQGKCFVCKGSGGIFYLEQVKPKTVLAIFDLSDMD